MDANKSVIITSTLSIVALTLLLNIQTKRVEKLAKSIQIEKIKNKVLGEMLVKNVDGMSEAQMKEFNKMFEDAATFANIINHIK